MTVRANKGPNIFIPQRKTVLSCPSRPSCVRRSARLKRARVCAFCVEIIFKDKIRPAASPTAMRLHAAICEQVTTRFQPAPTMKAPPFGNWRPWLVGSWQLLGHRPGPARSTPFDPPRRQNALCGHNLVTASRRRCLSAYVNHNRTATIYDVPALTVRFLCESRLLASVHCRRRDYPRTICLIPCGLSHIKIITGSTNINPYRRRDVKYYRRCPQII